MTRQIPYGLVYGINMSVEPHRRSIGSRNSAPTVVNIMIMTSSAVTVKEKSCPLHENDLLPV